MPTNSEMLAAVPLFVLLDEPERAVLAERLDVVSVPAGKMLFNRGDPGDAMYVVISGRVEIFFKNDTGERIVLEVVHAGGFFGEISLLDAGARTASALVLDELEALLIDHDDLEHLLAVRPAAALHLLAAAGRRSRETAELLRHTASRNVNEETLDSRTVVMKAADWISAFSGSIPFLLLHCVVFAIWILFNVDPLSRRLGGWDTFPFGLLTMVVSLEAIILSVFVLLSQNRQAARDKVRNDIEYDVNLKAELEIAHLHEKVDQLNDEVISRLAGIEKALARPRA